MKTTSELLKEKLVQKSTVVDQVEEHSVQILALQAELRYLDFEIGNLVERLKIERYEESTGEKILVPDEGP